MWFSAVRKAAARDAEPTLFESIGHFLSAHDLGCDPAAYSFAHRVVADPDSPFAQMVATLSASGVKLTLADIAALDDAAAQEIAAGHALEQASALAEQTRSQLANFTGLVDRVRAETTGFGRDLAASFEALDPNAAPAIADVTAAMLDRVQAAEARLAAATGEAEALRAELEAARVDARADPLTGLANRRALTEAYAGRKGAACLAMCDIDHFKRVNDRFGHAVGDRVLAAIAASLSQACPDALVARYGGEEFAVLFGHGDIDAATEALDAARATIASKRYRLREDDAVVGTVTVSIGVVAADRRESFDAAVGRADALLYAAKAGGRNRVRTEAE